VAYELVRQDISTTISNTRAKLDIPQRLEQENAKMQATYQKELAQHHQLVQAYASSQKMYENHRMTKMNVRLLNQEMFFAVETANGQI
jgi:hypothetical protein